MALKFQPSFSAGELDPALQERTTLEKYKSGLKTARNVNISRSGRLVSRAGRKHFIKTKLDDREVVLFGVSGMVVEWGHQYVRVYGPDLTTPLVGDYSHSFTETQLPDIQFVEISTWVLMIFQDGQSPLYLNLGSGGGFVTGFFSLPAAPTFVSSTNTGTGYSLDYAFTSVFKGEESLVFSQAIGGLPILAGESVIINLKVGAWADRTLFTEMKVYRRPKDGGAYGYIGSSTVQLVSGADLVYKFEDTFEETRDADYTNNPPEPNIDALGRSGSTDPLVLKSRTAAVYQQRLCLSFGDVLYVSRVGFPFNFHRDHPLGDNGSLSLKAGSGNARMLRLIDSDGLICFTTRGIFTNTGQLGIANLALLKKGNWVIYEPLPPIAIPGAILFIDSATNTVRQLTFSEELKSYAGEELSIFSDHFFKGRQIKAWAFQDGEFPLLWVIFTDGDAASFTYEREHQMRAWTRHDSVYDLEYVTSIENKGIDAGGFERGPSTLFVTNKAGKRYIEIGVPRYASATTVAADSEYNLGETSAAMDAMVSWSDLINDDIVDDTITVTPVVADTWDGDLTLSVTDDAIFPDPGAGAVGEVIRHFDNVDQSVVDLTVTARASDNSITVSPSATYPSDQATDPRLYLTAVTFTGLDHLDGESVSVMVDGAVVSSPNNDIDNYPVSTPSSGSLTLPNSLRGAIVHIGRPFTADVETLDIDTVEQRPTLIESKTLNKLYVKVHNSRGLYVGNSFTADDKVAGMVTLDDIAIDYEDTIPIIGNRAPQLQSRRYEVTIPGDWETQGRVCLRQVDPLHFEILSIIPDLEDQGR